MKVCEIFTSIQGESSHSGKPCTFIRLTGCNLRCTYCDTAYAYSGGNELSQEYIMKRIRHAGIRLVEITGGEPLLQEEVYPFVERLIKDEYKVLVETNGSVRIKDIDERAIVILDVKTPGSGMNDKMYMMNLELVKSIDEIKFVLTDRKDYEWSKDVIYSYNLLNKCHILLSPAYGRLQPEALAEWMIEDRLEVRLNLQIHKYIYGPEKKGV